MANVNNQIALGFLIDSKTEDYAWNSSTYEPAKSFIDADGLVTLHGIVRVVGGTPLVPGDVLAEVDEEHRPAKQSVHVAVANNGLIRVHVQPDGKVIYDSLTGSPSSVDKFVSLNGIAFLSAN